MAPLAGRVKTRQNDVRTVVNAAPTSQSYDFQTAVGAKIAHVEGKRNFGWESGR